MDWVKTTARRNDFGILCLTSEILWYFNFFKILEYKNSNYASFNASLSILISGKSLVQVVQHFTDLCKQCQNQVDKNVLCSFTEYMFTTFLQHYNLYQTVLTEDRDNMLLHFDLLVETPPCPLPFPEGKDIKVNKGPFLYACLKNGRLIMIMPWQCPSVCPSIFVFRTFFQHALRYQFETWHTHSVGGMTCRVWVWSQLGHFDLVYSQK